MLTPHFRDMLFHRVIHCSKLHYMLKLIFEAY